jgi:hypothetical protein
MTHTFTGIQVDTITGMPRGTLARMKCDGLSAPECNGLWSHRQALALYILRAARRQGAPLTAALAAHGLLERTPPSLLDRELEAGRRYLMLIGESMTMRLLPAERAFDPRWRDHAIAENLPLVLIDVLACREALEQRIEALDITSKGDAENFPSDLLHARPGRPITL